MIPKTRASVSTIAILTAAACKGGGPPPQTPPPHAEAPAHHDHGHSHGHGHGHRFEHAEQWAAKLDDPERDAWQHPKDVIDAMEITTGMTVADIGAGTGYFEPWLSRAVGPDGSVLARDVEPDMVRYLTERATREKLANVRALVATLDDPKIPEGTADRILVVDTWHHIEGRAAYAEKIRRSLKPGGKVFIVDFKLDATQGPPPEMRLAPDVIVRDLVASGLTAKVLSTNLPQQYIVAGSRP